MRGLEGKGKSIVGFAGSRSLSARWFGLVRAVVSHVRAVGGLVVVGDSWGADFLVARACSSLGVPCLVVSPPRPWSRLSFVASGRVPSGISLASAVVSPSLPLSRRLSLRSRVVASLCSVGFVFGAGRGSLGVFARSVLRRGGLVVWFPCGSPLSVLSSFGLRAVGRVRVGQVWGYVLALGR